MLDEPRQQFSYDRLARDEVALVGGLPSGTVTFLCTDIESSTRLLRHLGDASYAAVLAEYVRLFRIILVETGGEEIDAKGDGFLFAFRSARDAVAAAVAAQRAISTHPWPYDTSIRVRMAVHTGEPIKAGYHYVGLDVHRAARICAAAHGEQILLSLASASLVQGNLPPGISLRDLGLHRLKDLEHSEKIFQVLHPDLLADFPPLRSLGSFLHNLPRQLTSFVGREREIAEVKRLLSLTRLLTLAGSGGCGKTRLAVRVASDVCEKYPDGVWLVDLAALSDPALVPQAVASALRVREVSGRTLLETLVETLANKPILLILDNCEHLVAGCASLVEAVLAASQGTQILVTSREPLRVPGETVWRVPSLSLPDPERPPSTGGLMSCEAVRLFVERVVSALPSFTLNPENAAAVAAVCQRLDGIPLAIELAAARVPVLSIHQIADRLGDRFALLTGGSRTALPRQQTLRATMDWSYQLLCTQERVMLNRLSVFAGCWTLEAAESVCVGQEIERREILDLLSSLTSKSLMTPDLPHDIVLYRFLETVRQYGRERLRESGEEAQLRKRHLEWYARLAERAELEFEQSQQTVWFNRFEIEHDNIRNALEWSLENGNTEAGLRLAGAAWRFWFVRGHLAEGRRWLERLLTSTDAGSDAARAKALNAAGNLDAFGQVDYGSAGSLYEESLNLWRRVGDSGRIARVLNNLGHLAFNQGDYPKGRSLYEESLATCRGAADRWGVALALNNLGHVTHRQGDYLQARSWLEESLAIWRDLGDKQNVARALTNLGLTATAQGDTGLAFSLLKEGLDVRRELEDKWGIPESLEAVADLAIARHQPGLAARLLAAAEVLRESIGSPLQRAERPGYEHTVAAARAALGEVAFATAWAAGRAMTVDQAFEEAERSSDTYRGPENSAPAGFAQGNW